jgi:peptidoglycan/LPS O-acetylase OafA/YrhL
MSIAGILQFHSTIHQTLSGIILGIIYYFWLRSEICFYRDRAPWKLLVWAGRWSYSLYLMHPIVIALLLWYDASILESRAGWLAAIAVVLLSSYAFYLTVERPSHNFARRIPLFASGRLAKRFVFFGTS